VNVANLVNSLGQGWHLLTAAAFISMVLPLIVFFGLQRYFVRGILGGDAAPQQFIPMLIEYWRQGRLPFDRMIRFYDFADLPAAFKDAGEGRTIKPVLRMPA
jgi:Zn-dependent alcohol dehydrogenase